VTLRPRRAADWADDKVAKHAYPVTNEDITAARASGLAEDQIFEIVVCAAISQLTWQYDTAFATLETATERSEHASRDPRIEEERFRARQRQTDSVDSAASWLLRTKASIEIFIRTATFAA
jgi:hypothetical protein